MVNEIPDHSIILLRGICDSCGKNSGPILTLPEIRDRSDLLRENVVPDGFERQKMLQDIGMEEETISQIDVEINRLKQMVTSLRQQRKVLRDSVDRGKSLFAPIRKLPDDVLRQLFVTCQRYFSNEGFIDVYDRKETFVATIMNVCTHWRQVARSSPELWSRITVVDCCPGDEQFLDVCISFSGEIPLYMRISTHLEDSCIQRIARCAYRWKEIELFDGEAFTDIAKYIGPDLIFHSLERLSIRNEVGSTISINPSPILSYFHICELSGLVTVSFKSAPRLRNLCIECVQHPMSTFIDLPWAQITTFESTFNQYDVNELALVLKSMPNLVSFTLEGEPHITETVTLPSIKVFTLANITDVHYPGILDAFTAPNVETLHLESGMYTSSVFQFLTRSCCPLSDLKLTYTFLDRECMEICSGSLRTVKTLCLIVPDPEWNDILLSTPSHLAFPQLQSLEMRWVNLQEDRKFSDVVEPVIHMLKSRIAPIQQSSGPDSGDFSSCSLKRVTIMFTDRFRLTEEEKNAFSELIRSDLVRQSGVKISIGHEQEDRFIIRNGVAIDEVITNSEETSTDKDTTDLDDSTNSSQDANTDSEETSASGDESTESLKYTRGTINNRSLDNIKGSRRRVPF